MARKSAAITERERLEEELRTLGRARGDAGRAEAQANSEAKTLTSTYRTELQKAARGDGSAEARAEKAREAIAAKRAEAATAHDRAEAAEKARRDTERELRTHLFRNLPAFIEEAERASAEAVASRQAVIDAVADAADADAAARRAWRPLIGAVRTVSDDGKTFGGKTGKDLGAMPPTPAILGGTFASDLASAPPPSPAYVRDRKQAQRAARGDLLPTAVRRLLGGRAAA
ncbi:MAG: hypothetical protein M9964_00455 [Solirubrobacterales bacterium]|nr:hypothetical protein [Thermoleophilales bacterium]MCO5325524.1 hypothetical protein [Solirubrobacterales bacterium]